MNRSYFGSKLSQRRLGPPSTIHSSPVLPRRMPLRRTTGELPAGGCAQSRPFLWVTKLTTSRDVGAKGGNVLLLSGSVHWRNIKSMSNYWAFQSGFYWNAW